MDITSANSTAVLTVLEIAPNGIILEAYSTDQSIGAEAVDIAETRKGIDGYMAAGYVPAIFPVTINLEANSPSYPRLCEIWEASQTNRTIYECALTITIPSIGQVFTYSNGVMKNGSMFPTHSKVLDPTAWQFDFGTVERSSI
jgi:hypothetical protein